MPKSTHIFERPLQLEQGGELEYPRVAYTTHGTLSENKDNVIVIVHALTASSEADDWWHGFFGQGELFDPSSDFIICCNNLGSPYGTSSPITPNTQGRMYGMDFPAMTLRDAANLHLMMLAELGIKEVKLLIGGSCGGNIAQEMAIQMGTALHELILLCCSAQETPWVIAIHESQRMAIESDPTLWDNHLDAGEVGLRAARASAMPFYRSHPSFKMRQADDTPDKFDDYRAASYVRYQGDKFVHRYNAQCYYKQLIALDTHHVGRGRGSVQRGLAGIKAPTLVIGFDTDMLIPVVEQKFLAEHIPLSRYAEVETIFGHDAFLIEYKLMKKAISSWRKTLAKWK